MPTPEDVQRMILEKLRPPVLPGATGLQPAQQPAGTLAPPVVEPQGAPQGALPGMEQVGPNLWYDPSTGIHWTLDIDNYGTMVPRPASPDEVRRATETAGGAGDPYGAVYADIARQEEQRRQEMHPVEMEMGQTQIDRWQQQMETERADLERQILDDRFERAMDAQEAAVLAEDLARAKRRDAADTLRDMTEYLVPPGMEYIPGMEPGGLASQVFGRSGYDYTATPIQPVAGIDFSQFTQPNPQMDAAVQYLLNLQQQYQAV